ncbi:hypothetical protein [Saccharopolyspora sp. NPDC002376]
MRARRAVSKQWPHIRRFLCVKSPHQVDHEFHRWWGVERGMSAAERAAARARGDDPGERIPQSQRRPDLDGEGRAIVERTETSPQEHTQHLRKVG